MQLFIRVFAFACLLHVSVSAHAANGCGPEGAGLLVPDGPFPFLSYFDAFATYEDACNNHDDCYGVPNRTQPDCDKQFLVDLLNSCQNYPALLLDYCENTAYLYHKAVAQFGEIAKDGVVSGHILSVTDRRIWDFWGDDEFEACVLFENNGVVNTEYQVELWSKSGQLIDVEPDTHETNLAVDQKTTLCVGTDYIYPSISDLGSHYTVVLTVDHPKDDLTEVDRVQRQTP